MRFSIAELQAAGVTDTQIVRLVAERQASERERDRIKKRNQRSRPQCPAGQAGHVVHVSSFLSLKKKERKKNTHTLSADWKPSEADRVFARSKGFDEWRIDREAERFRIYHLERQTRINSDHLTWCKWVTSPYQQRGASNGNDRGRPRLGSEDLDRMFGKTTTREYPRPQPHESWTELAKRERK